MKVLFTADVHIKLGQKNVPNEWSVNRFNLFLEQFGVMQERADLVIIGGDIFDRVPTPDELGLYLDFVSSFTKPTIIYSGNHEAIKKDTTFLSFLKRGTKNLNPLVSIVDDFYSLPAFNVDIVPYNKLRTFVDEYSMLDFHEKILCTHVRGEIPPHVKPEINLDLLNRWEVVLAGDLHSYDNSQRNILYPGSPYTTSFHRDLVETGAILLDTETLKHEWIKFDLPQLLRKTIRAGDPMPATTFHHTIYEVEGDLLELAGVENTALLDKKISKRETDVALILDPTMSIRDELREYLLYIVQLDEAACDRALHYFDEIRLND